MTKRNVRKPSYVLQMFQTASMFEIAIMSELDSSFNTVVSWDERLEISDNRIVPQSAAICKCQSKIISQRYSCRRKCAISAAEDVPLLSPCKLKPACRGHWGVEIGADFCRHLGHQMKIVRKCRIYVWRCWRLVGGSVIGIDGKLHLHLGWKR